MIENNWTPESTTRDDRKTDRLYMAALGYAHTEALRAAALLEKSGSTLTRAMARGKTLAKGVSAAHRCGRARFPQRCGTGLWMDCGNRPDKRAKPLI
ncbi:hypothetical protein [Cupriavidus pinatubonensis]|uniref:hypothetical protein n=1 Tax=Cupriavidus pinatubonensis TaxID=248026 RepID=UPI003609C46E